MFDLIQERDTGSRLAPRTMVYVITHGVTDESGGLSEAGKNQVVDLARSRVVAGVTMVYSSSAKDTSTTAKILSKEFGAKTNTKDCLGEVKLGKGTLGTEELARVLCEMWKDTDYQPEKGESLMEARHRLAEVARHCPRYEEIIFCVDPTNPPLGQWGRYLQADRNIPV